MLLECSPEQSRSTRNARTFKRCGHDFAEQLSQSSGRARTQLGFAFTLRATRLRCIDVSDADLLASVAKRIAIDHAFRSGRKAAFREEGRAAGGFDLRGGARSNYAHASRCPHSRHRKALQGSPVRNQGPDL